MPPTEEIACLDDECFLDMFEVHYTYDVPDAHDLSGLSCPVCQRTDSLERIEL